MRPSKETWIARNLVYANMTNITSQKLNDIMQVRGETIRSLNITVMMKLPSPCFSINNCRRKIKLGHINFHKPQESALKNPYSNYTT
jgi:hypothetical protein